MPHFQKGSPEAKAYMASIRGRRGNPLTRKETAETIRLARTASSIARIAESQGLDLQRYTMAARARGIADVAAKYGAKSMRRGAYLARTEANIAGSGAPRAFVHKTQAHLQPGYRGMNPGADGLVRWLEWNDRNGEYRDPPMSAEEAAGIIADGIVGNAEPGESPLDVLRVPGAPRLTAAEEALVLAAYRGANPHVHTSLQGAYVDAYTDEKLASRTVRVHDRGERECNPPMLILGNPGKSSSRTINPRKPLHEMTLGQLQVAALKAFPSSPAQNEIRAEISKRLARGEKAWTPPPGHRWHNPPTVVECSGCGFHWHPKTAAKAEEMMGDGCPECGCELYVTRSPEDKETCGQCRGRNPLTRKEANAVGRRVKSADKFRSLYNARGDGLAAANVTGRIDAYREVVDDFGPGAGRASSMRKINPPAWAESVHRRFPHANDAQKILRQIHSGKSIEEAIRYVVGPRGSGVHLLTEPEIRKEAEWIEFQKGRGENPLTRSEAAGAMRYVGWNRRNAKEAARAGEGKRAAWYIGRADGASQIAGDFAGDQRTRDTVNRRGVKVYEEAAKYVTNPAGGMPLDDYQMRHLGRWIDAEVHPKDREKTIDLMLAFISDHPDLVEKGRSWPEIRNLAERRGRNPLDNLEASRLQEQIHIQQSEAMRAHEVGDWPRIIYHEGVRQGVADVLQEQGPHESWRGFGRSISLTARRNAANAIDRVARRVNPSSSAVKMRRGGARMLPARIANNPAFKREYAAYVRRHGCPPARVTVVNSPAGSPRFASAWGHAPEIKYDPASDASNKGPRVHKFGEEGGTKPYLVSSVEKGPRYLGLLGGTFRAGGEWILR